MSTAWWWIRWTFTVFPRRFGCKHPYRYDARWCLWCGKDTLPRKWRKTAP